MINIHSYLCSQVQCIRWSNICCNILPIFFLLFFFFLLLCFLLKILCLVLKALDKKLDFFFWVSIISFINCYVCLVFIWSKSVDLLKTFLVMTGQITVSFSLVKRILLLIKSIVSYWKNELGNLDIFIFRMFLAVYIGISNNTVLNY